METLTNNITADYASVNLGTINSLTPRPFITLHPLSTQVYSEKSHYTGLGISPLNKYDDYWLYTNNKTDMNATPYYHHFTIILALTTLSPVNQIEF